MVLFWVELTAQCFGNRFSHLKSDCCTFVAQCTYQFAQMHRQKILGRSLIMMRDSDFKSGKRFFSVRSGKKWLRVTLQNVQQSNICIECAEQTAQSWKANSSIMLNPSARDTKIVSEDKIFLNIVVRSANQLLHESLSLELQRQVSAIQPTKTLQFPGKRQNGCLFRTSTPLIWQLEKDLQIMFYQ